MLRRDIGQYYIDNEDDYIPEPGDLIFFHHIREADDRKDMNFPNHIGIVVGVNEKYNTVYTVEGNNLGLYSDYFSHLECSSPSFLHCWHLHNV